MNSHISKITGIILKRDKQKLLLTFFSLFIGALVLTVILGLIANVRFYLQNESKSLIGGDIVIQRSFPVEYQDSQVIDEIMAEGGAVAEKMSTMVTFYSREKEIAILASLKTVSESYPLYGKITTKSGNTTLPDKNSIYAEQSFLDRLGIQTGDSVFIGDTGYTVKEILEAEPDSFGGGFSFGPPVLMSGEGWQRAGLSKDESRISYSLMVRYPEKANKAALDEKITGEYQESGTRISTAEQGPERLVSILENTGRFFLTVTVLTLFLIVVNIRSNLVYLLDYFTKTIAVFRTLGMKRKNIFLIFTLLMLITGGAAGLVGNAAGNSLSMLLSPGLENFIRADLPATGLIDNLPVIILLTIGLCLLSALPALLKTMDIEPKMVLTRDFKEVNRKRAFVREALALSLLAGGLFLGVLFLTGNLRISLISIISLTVVFILFIMFVRLVIFLLYKNKFRLSFKNRAIINFVKNQGVVGETVIASLALSLTCIFTISQVQYNIEKNLQGSMREDLPNLYVIDVQEKQKPFVETLFKDKLTLYPNIQARFISIGNKKTEGQRELSRSFNLTYRTELIEGEKLYSGEWHGENEKNAVSVEKKFAERAGISLGSELEFSIQGIPVKAKVTSFRTVEETNGLPFFFLVFSPDVIGDAPKSYFGFAYFPEKEIPVLQNQMALLFPNIATIPTNDIVSTVRNITGLVLNTVISVALPALILGLLLIFSMVANSARERFKDLMLFKSFGAEKSTILRVYLYESLSFIFISTAFALLVSFVVSYYINLEFFKFSDYYFSPGLLFYSLGIFAFSLLFSLYLIRKMFSLPPAVLFRSEV